MPYAQQFIPREELELFTQIKRVIEHLEIPDLGFNENGDPIALSCHVLARATAQVFPVRVRDGYFAGHYNHSRVETLCGHLIDVYPIAMISGPIMFDGHTASPSRVIYTPLSAKKLSRGRFGKNSFRRAVRRVARALRAELKTQGQ